MEIHIIDLQHLQVRHTIAAFLVVGPGGPLLVETGPQSAHKQLLAGLAEHGYEPEQIKHVFVTHIHLDHAGGAGWWAQQGAQIYVHHRGARHLIDPSRLLASAQRIYGDAMDSLWGDILPAPAECVSSLSDGDRIDVCGLQFTALDTPGHATHHHVFKVEDVAFAGDICGVRMPDTRLLSLAAPPPEFDLEDWVSSVSRLLVENFNTIYPTHFGRYDDPRPHLEALVSLLSQSAEFVRDRMQADMARSDLINEYEAWQRERSIEYGITDETVNQINIASGHEASVDGLMRYWRKRLERENYKKKN